VVTSVSSIVKGLDKVNTEIETLQTLGISPSGDRFIPVMRNFATSAAPSVVRIQKMGVDVDQDLKALLSFFGEQAEGPEATRPEDFFGMVLAFSLALQRAAAEVTKHLAGGTTSSVVSSKVRRARAIFPCLLLLTLFLFPQ
jgi:diaphanous 1